MPSDEVLPLLLIYAGLLGTVLGSFLNVCIVRWGAEPKQSVVRPRSRCPRCGHAIRWYENLPVLSWIALRGRCSGCHAPISPLYPAIEIVTGLLWAGSVWLLGPTLAALELAVAATLLLGIAVSDARAFIIPHEFSLGGTFIALAFALAAGADGVWAAVQGALFGAGVVLLVGEITELILGQEAMGGGDCALMGMVGAFFGWEAVLPVVALGALVSLVLYFIAALWPRRSHGEGDAAGAEGPPPLRWGKVLKLVAGGLGLVLLMGVALRAGLFPPLLVALFHAVLGAGAAYYLGFAVPERAVRGGWPRVRGLLGAAAGLAVGGGGAWQPIAAGILLAVVALSWADRAGPAASPETTEELSAGGYLPFGVGLALAAGVLAYAGGYDRVRETFAELAPALGLS
ncbi:MAG TPA: prepilin peptidase [Gemmatimonadales bacterium]